MSAIIEVARQTGNDEFYPTPPELAAKLMEGLEWANIKTILEPSAGKGDLLKKAISLSYIHKGYHRRELFCDCIEIDPYLRGILKHSLYGDVEEKIRNRYYELARDSRNRSTAEYNCLKKQIETMNSTEVHVVHDDFLTFNGYKKYDLIVMNPPFSNGDEHLIKALEIQKHGGEIRCLLNAETLNNLYTNRRKVLWSLLNEYGAEITYVQNAFKSAERQTDVEVAIVRVSIPHGEELESEFYSRFEKAAEYRETPEDASAEIVIADFIQNLVQRYDVEVRATLKFMEEYRHLCRYMTRGISDESFDKSPILNLTLYGKDRAYDMVSVNEYMSRVRLKYWRYIFSHREFTGKLTSELAQKYQQQVDKMANYEFSMFNIQQLMVEVNASMLGGVKKAVMDLFDRLSAQHSWYPECEKNVHYYNGWKTNKAHKVGMKAIIPTNGMFSSWKWKSETFDEYAAFGIINDIEKVFNYLDGEMTAEVDLRSVLQRANATGQTRNIECKFFSITLYKKGTTHIKFHRQDLIDRLNIFAARNRNWLPPDYGYTPYKDLGAEAKEVVDGFQGEAAYNAVVADRERYLFEVKDNSPLLLGGDMKGAKSHERRSNQENH